MKKGVDYIGVGVGAIIFNTDGKVFLARRGDTGREAHDRVEEEHQEPEKKDFKQRQKQEII